MKHSNLTQHISQFLDNPDKKINLGQEKQIPLNPLAVRLVDQIFVKMALLCRGFDTFFADRNRLNAEKTQWILTFTKMNLISKEQIQCALNKLECYKYPNPPQLGEFIDWCTPSADNLGFPNIREAFRIGGLINEKFSDYTYPDLDVHRVIKHAIKQIGAYDYRLMNEKEAFKLFEHYYTIACRDFMHGKLKEANKAITEKPDKHPSDPERAEEARLKCMEELRRMGIANQERMQATTQ